MAKNGKRGENLDRWKARKEFISLLTIFFIIIFAFEWLRKEY